MPTVTASTPMPIMPLLPEFDSLSDDEAGLSTRFYAALYATAHRFVTGVRAKRSYAAAYVSALTHYLQTFTSCDYFTLLDIEVKAGRTESAAERARCVRSRRAARAALDQLGARLPESVHNGAVASRRRRSYALHRPAGLHHRRENPLAVAPLEAPAVLAALEGGKVDGSTYEGTCACLVGTMERSAEKAERPAKIPHDGGRPAEMFFQRIRPGDTPENSPDAAIAAVWVRQFLARLHFSQVEPVTQGE